MVLNLLADLLLDLEPNCLVGAVGEVHADDVKTRCCLSVLLPSEKAMVFTFSKHGDLLGGVGLWACILLERRRPLFVFELTNCADDTGSAVSLLGSIVDVQRRMPLHLCAVVEVV